MPKDSYVCPRCGYVLPKKEAIVSGYDSQSSLRHIHCPKCGKIITHTFLGINILDSKEQIRIP